jgi:hypothetical protein
VKPWLLIFGLLLLSAGCILVPEIEGKPEQPLYPPEIVLDTLEPPDNGLFLVDVDVERCSPLVFRVGLVRDRNIEDTLYLRWFLDWDPTDTGEWQDWLILPNDKTERPGRDIEFDLSEFSALNIHTLKVVVADRPLDPGGNGAEFPEVSDGQLDSYQWTFQLELGSGYCNPGGS